MIKRLAKVAAIAVLVISYTLVPAKTASVSAGTIVGFYNTKCSRAESIIQETVKAYFNRDKTIAPGLLRMFFHDCFVRGADASILINSTRNNEAERDARPNLTVRGFDLIEEAKMAVEKECPGIVSCADIIALAVRDAVFLTGGPQYDVPCGRRDGLVSLKTDAQTLPAPDFPLEQAREAFFEKGLNNQDFVVLLGAHTIGESRCGFFSERVYNFRGTGTADPSMNSNLVTKLEGVCPNPFFSESNADPSVPLDQVSPSVFDTSYYNLLLQGNGVLQIDQELITGDNTTAALVTHFTDRQNFFQAFVESIVKMGNIGVHTGTQGEIRLKCNAVNHPAPVANPPQQRIPDLQGKPETSPPATQHPSTQLTRRRSSSQHVSAQKQKRHIHHHHNHHHHHHGLPHRRP